MKELFSNTVAMKLAMVLVAAALYIAGSYVPGAADALHMLAASIAGGAMIRRPGDAKTDKAKQEDEG